MLRPAVTVCHTPAYTRPYWNGAIAPLDDARAALASAWMPAPRLLCEGNDVKSSIKDVRSTVPGAATPGMCLTGDDRVPLGSSDDLPAPGGCNEQALATLHNPLPFCRWLHGVPNSKAIDCLVLACSLQFWPYVSGEDLLERCEP